VSDLDWCDTTIGNICAITTGKLDVNASEEEGAYPFFTCAERVYRINEFAFDTEAVLFAGNGFFNVKYYKGKFNAYQRTYVLHQLKLNGRYLFHYISHRMGKITGGSRGSTIKYIRLADLRDHPIRVPSPETQVEIVAEIETQLSRIDEAVSNLQRVKANLKRYKASVLKAAVEGRLVETEATLARREGRTYETGEQLLLRILEERRVTWGLKKKYVEPAIAERCLIESLPEGWKEATVEQLSQLVEYGSSSKTSDDSTGVPVLRMGNIFEGELRFDELKYLPSDHEEFPKLLLKDGDLLFNRTNSPELVGKVAVFRSKPTNYSFASYLIRVRTLAGALPEFLAAFINSSFGRQWVKSVVTQQVGQANVNGTKLQALSVPLPPLAEQTRIVAEVDRHLSIIREVEAEVETNLQRAQALRQATLAKAFAVNS
jgi:type I restriction enzyme, S subunit